VITYECTVRYFEFNSHHPHKLSHRRWRLDALQIFSTYFLTSAVECQVELHSCKSCRSATEKTFQCICRMC